MNASETEVLRLTNLMLEDQLSGDDVARLTELLKADPANVRLYVEFVELHGQLMWDAGLAPVFEPAEKSPSVLSDQTTTIARRRPADRGRERAILSSSAVIILLAVLVGVFVVVMKRPGEPGDVVDNTPGALEDSSLEEATSGNGIDVADAGDIGEPVRPIRLDQLNDTSPRASVDADGSSGRAADETDRVSLADRPPIFSGNFSDDVVVAFIDDQLRLGWAANEVGQSPRADDTEWIRRAYVAFAGRIPTLKETNAFIAGRSSGMRSRLIRKLAASEERAENLSEIWANLLVGRSPRREIDRSGLQDFLRAEFAQNRPWIGTVGELVSARGRSDQNGATNFLLAHLNNDATPATAVTARLFLGQQLQCVQCHDHPFAKDVSQKSYWAFNAFFKQTARVWHLVDDPLSADGTKSRVAALVDKPTGGMTFYETRRGEQRAVLPEFAGTVLAQDENVSRRDELVRLLAADTDARVARAMVNRMWAHFFGYGFTRPIDDIGPHVPVSHPELLDGLTAAYVESGYNVQRLMSWVAMSAAWQLSSVGVADNEVDDPDSGESPLFSRVYTRRMTPEEVYRSIRVAVRTAADVPLNAPVDGIESGNQHKRYWVAQFVRDYETDENDEADEFDGTVAQALVMMNGDDVDDAIHQAAQMLVSQTGDASGRNRPASAATVLDRIAMALLTRPPTDREVAVFRSRLAAVSRNRPAAEALLIVVEDMLWAYLNSSEFVLVH